MTQLPVPTIQFNTDDKGGEYLKKLNDTTDALKAAITQYNAQLQAATDAASIKAAIVQLKASIQAISESGLPSQSGQANKALVSNGAATAWVHTMGFNRAENDNFTLKAGDKVKVTVTKEIAVTAPAAVSLMEPFYIENSKSSTHNAIFTLSAGISYSVLPIKGNTPAVGGDTIPIPPGEHLALQCTQANKLEAI